MPSDSSYSGYVYLIGSRQFGWFKIGKSRTPDIRINDIGILLPFRIELFAIWGTKNHSALESAFHRKYAEQHIHGEWFLFNRKTLEAMIIEYPPFWATRIFPAGDLEAKEITRSAATDRSKKVSEIDYRNRREHYHAFKEAVAAEMAKGVSKSKAKQRVLSKVAGLWTESIDKFRERLTLLG